MPQLEDGRWLRLAHVGFALFMVLALCTPSWRTGPFTWWPVWHLAIPPGQPVPLGILSLLPLVCVLAWTADWINRHAPPILQWGSPAIVWPLLVLSLLILLGLEPALNERTVVQGIGLGLFWFSYLYTLNHRPHWTPVLLTVILVQGGVALAQFALQRDLGLAFIGEFNLDPQVSGTSVLWDSSREVWLRGYGLTAHPNVLGGMLAVLLLVLLVQQHQQQWWRQVLVAAGLVVGSLGLLVTFSRTGWLAFIAGVLYLAIRHGDSRDAPLAPRRYLRASWLPLLIVPLFLLLYHDLVLNRWFQLDTLIEARSIHERLRDAQIALHLIAAHPWLGVGAGNALASAQLLRADAGSVHNVPLLVTVELGLLGGLCWLSFMLLPLLPSRERFKDFRLARYLPSHAATARTHAYGAVWIGLLIAGLFDTPLWLTTSWRAALLLGFLAALLAQAQEGRKEDSGL